MHRDMLPEGSEVAQLTLTFEGACVVPYPQELTQEVDLRAFCASAGLSIAEDDKIVTTYTDGSVAYAIRLSGESAKIVEELQARGVEVTFDTPLAGVFRRAVIGSRRPKTVALRIEGATTYVAYSEEKRVRYVEALPTNGEEQLVNLVALLNRDFDLRKARFILLGEASARYYKTLRKYFRRVSREK